MPSSRTIRPAGAADLESLTVVWREMMTMHQRIDANFLLAADAEDRWQGMAADMLSREDAFVHCACDGGSVVGFALGWIAQNPPIYARSQVGFVSELAVRVAYRRRGLGRALVAGAREWFLAHGVDEFQLSTAVWNEAAHSLWRKLGGERLLVRYRFSCHSTEPGVASRRHHARAPLTLLVQLRSDTVDEFMRQYAVNLSCGGMFIRTEEPRAMHSMVYLQFRLADGSTLIEGLAKVVHVNPPGGEFAGMGLEFVNLDSESERLIRSIVRERLRGPA